MQEPEIYFSPAAKREFRKLGANVQRDVVRSIETLKATPRPRGVEKLTDYPGFYRLEVGRDFRVIYCLQSHRLIIICVIRNRKDAYRGLSSLKDKLEAAVVEIAATPEGRRLLAG